MIVMLRSPLSWTWSAELQGNECPVESLTKGVLMTCLRRHRHRQFNRLDKQLSRRHKARESTFALRTFPGKESRENHLELETRMISANHDLPISRFDPPINFILQNLREGAIRVLLEARCTGKDSGLCKNNLDMTCLKLPSKTQLNIIHP